MAKSADAFRTISEVADWLETPAHVLRFWESKFSQVKPVKRAGGRRYYRPADMELLGGIKKLLHDDGMTIKGVQKILREQGVKHVSALSQPVEPGLESYVDAASLEVDQYESFGESGQIVDFQPAGLDQEDDPPDPDPTESADTNAPEAPAPATPSMPDSAPDTTPAEALESADAPEDAGTGTTGDETTTPPVMPSFSHRRAEATTGAETGTETDIDAETPTEPDAEPEAEPPAREIPPEAAPAPPAFKPADVSVPDDPSDDVSAQAGLLSRLSMLRTPIGADKRHRIETLMDRLREVADRAAQRHDS